MQISRKTEGLRTELNRATTKKILDIIKNKYIPEIGKPSTIITVHGTQFKGRRWREKLLEINIKTYKTSVYHPSSKPAERVNLVLKYLCEKKQLSGFQADLAHTSSSHGKQILYHFIVFVLSLIHI